MPLFTFTFSMHIVRHFYWSKHAPEAYKASVTFKIRSRENDMQISINDHQDNLTHELREFAERRLRFALSRFTPRIDQVSLMVVDFNGPRGGVDKRCSVTVKLHRAAPIRVSSEDAEIEASIARAADKVGRAVARAIEREQTFDRRRPNPV